MRIRIDGLEVGVAKEARLALRYAGFVLADPSTEADFVIALEEATDVRHPVIASADGALERDLVNKMSAITPVVVLDRSIHRNDCAAVITLPPQDGLRRGLSRVLVEIFLEYLNRPVSSGRHLASARTLAIAATLDQMVQRLIETERTKEEIVADLARHLAPRRCWWEVWR